MSKAQRKLDRLQADLFDLTHRDDGYVIASPMTREQLQAQVTEMVEAAWEAAPRKVRNAIPVIVCAVFDAIEMADDIMLPEAPPEPKCACDTIPVLQPCG